MLLEMKYYCSKCSAEIDVEHQSSVCGVFFNVQPCEKCNEQLFSKAKFEAIEEIENDLKEMGIKLQRAKDKADS